MALTRARVVAGPPALRRRIAEALAAAALRPAGGRCSADAAAMRARMLRDLPPEGPWDVKLMPGGLVEVEFIAQALQLRHGAETPGVLSPTTRVALARLGAAGLLPEEEAAALIAADRLWRDDHRRAAADRGQDARCGPARAGGGGAAADRGAAARSASG